jgi:glutathione S-transferase
MSGEYGDDRKANALKTSLDYLDSFLSTQSYVAGDDLTVADFSILASITQLEAMDYKLVSYKCVILNLIPSA